MVTEAQGEEGVRPLIREPTPTVQTTCRGFFRANASMYYLT